MSIDKNWKDEVQERINQALLKAGALVEGSAKERCPVDTGTLRNSINYQLMDERTVIIGTNVEYAPYVEYGTVKMSAQPFLHPALEENREKINQLFRGII